MIFIFHVCADIKHWAANSENSDVSDKHIDVHYYILSEEK